MTERRPDIRSILLVFLRLGLTSFGGPIAHLGYFREELVVRRRWLQEDEFADLVALCQFLPGPASSQVGLAIGRLRGGLAGALAAWIGFTLPSAVLLILVAEGLASGSAPAMVGVLSGLELVAVAVVAHAVVGMARTLCPDLRRMAMMAAAAAAVLLMPSPVTQLAVIAAGALVGLVAVPRAGATAAAPSPAPMMPVRRRAAIGWLAVLAGLLVGLPLAASAWPSGSLALADAFYRVGSLVFGGGHVVLPMLRAEVVLPGWVTDHVFLGGYGAAQAVPGPLFTFAAFLGAASSVGPGGWSGGAIGLVAVFLPSFLLVNGVLPFWSRLRESRPARSALAGVNAAVVGLLAATLYRPIWTGAVHGPLDLAVALLAFLGLAVWRLPAWLVVLLTGAVGWLRHAVA